MKILRNRFKELIILLLVFAIVILTINMIRMNNKVLDNQNCKVEEKFYLDKSCYGADDFINISKKNIELLNESKASYILFTYNNFCSFSIPVDTIFKEFMSSYNVSFYAIPFIDFKETTFYDIVKYAPSVIIVKDGKIVDYLDANSDEDYEKYQDSEKFTNWLKEYIYIE